MTWTKLGMVFDLAAHKPAWLSSHAMTPTPLSLEEVIRVYYAGRDKHGVSRISFVDFSKEDPSRVVYVHEEPIMEIGKPGMFDDSGTICTCAVRTENEILLYYTGYSISSKVPYRNAIGVGVSTNGGTSFSRAFDGPIVDRSREEPYFTISPWVIKHDNQWHMWYASATDWLEVEERLESIYHIKYASSQDGKMWEQKNLSCILPLDPEEANARPSVIVEDNLLRMWFTYRGSRDFRDGNQSYQIGYAEASVKSPTDWTRMDSAFQSSIGSRDEYDKSMQSYPAMITINGKNHLYYNGNGFGANGFCLMREV